MISMVNEKPGLIRFGETSSTSKDYGEVISELEIRIGALEELEDRVIDIEQRVEELEDWKETRTFAYDDKGRLIKSTEIDEHDNTYFTKTINAIDIYSYWTPEEWLVPNQKGIKIKYMHEDLEKPVSVQDIANKLGMSYSSFRKYFKDYSGVSPSRYLQDIRLQHAKALLRTTELSIKEIAYRLHFETSDYFSSLFHKKTGLSPSEFRNL